MKPFFSILVPCCDVETYIRECLDSVLGQPFADWELVAVVETSKDRTEEIVREYAAKDSRISVFTQPRSGSPAAPRNTALEHATGEYVIFLDSDDRIAEGSLLRLHDKIAARPGAELYPCAIQVENEITGRREPVRDNYPADLNGELTGQRPRAPVFHTSATHARCFSSPYAAESFWMKTVSDACRACDAKTASSRRAHCILQNA